RIPPSRPESAGVSAGQRRRPTRLEWRHKLRHVGARLRVVITGAAGLIGRTVAPTLARRWDLQQTDLREGDGISALDVTDLARCRQVFDGADAVVHLAGVPDPDASWERLLPSNVVG